MMVSFFSLLLLMVAAPWQQQDGYLSPQQQKTLMEYLGPDARPLVPTAIKRTGEADANFAAQWIAGRRKQTLVTYSLSEKLPHYILQNGQTIEAVFLAAAEKGNVIYIEDADVLFGLKEPSTAQKLLATQLIQLAKKRTVALVLQCTGEDSWYELANAGFGIVDLKL